ncbi:MAG: hypothetical protein AB2L13_18635 [Spirochaetota bacterium]
MSRISGYVIERRNASTDEIPRMDSLGDDFILLTSYKNSWGEIDFSLPILYKMKEVNRNCTIVSIIESKEMVHSDKLMPVLFDMLSAVSDIIIYPAIKRNEQTGKISGKIIITRIYRTYYFEKYRQKVRNLLTKITPIWNIYTRIQSFRTGRQWSHFFNNVIHPRKVNIVLEDRTKPTKLQELIREKCINAKIVLYPHATSLYLKEHLEKVTIVKKSADLLLVASILGLEWAKKSYRNVSNIVPVGFPRYDKWWIETLARNGEIKHIKEYLKNKNINRVYTFFTNGIDPKWLPYKDFKYMMDSLCEIVFKDSNSFLIIKPHPRQDLNVIKMLMAKYPSDRWIITNMPAIQASLLADFVVSMWSSAILDALANGKPVVEFFHHGKNPFAIVDGSGRHCSEYGYARLSIPAETKEELYYFVKDYFRGNSSLIWEEQRTNAREILKLDNQSSQRAAEVINKLVTGM